MENQTLELNALKKKVDDFCELLKVQRIPLNVKAVAIMFLSIKFKEIPSGSTKGDEINLLMEFYPKKSASDLPELHNNSHLKFLRSLKEEVINDHSDFEAFKSKDHQSIEDKIRLVELLATVTDTTSENFRKLVILLFNYYVGRYQSFSE
jgi:hypothetical protein